MERLVGFSHYGEERNVNLNEEEKRAVSLMFKMLKKKKSEARK